MATTANLALEIYLHSDFQPDAEFIDGEILERPAPEDDHSAWQSAICTSFAKSASAWNSRVRP
jgi:hypothetical protein